MEEEGEWVQSKAAAADDIDIDTDTEKAIALLWSFANGKKI